MAGSSTALLLTSLKHFRWVENDLTEHLLKTPILNSNVDVVLTISTQGAKSMGYSRNIAAIATVGSNPKSSPGLFMPWIALCSGYVFGKPIALSTGYRYPPF